MWGLGVPLWRQPFEATAKLLGFYAFFDRIAFDWLAALSGFYRALSMNKCLALQSITTGNRRLGWAFGADFLLLSLVPALSPLAANEQRHIRKGNGLSISVCYFVARLVWAGRTDLWPPLAIWMHKRKEKAKPMLSGSLGFVALLGALLVCFWRRALSSGISGIFMARCLRPILTIPWKESLV